MVDWKHYLAEFFGTFTFVLLGCCAVAAGLDHIEVALAFGLGLYLACSIFGEYSRANGQFNPCISLASLLLTEHDLQQVLAFVGTCVAQIAGALVAAELVACLYGINTPTPPLTIPAPLSSWYSVMLAEFTGTLFLTLYVVLIRSASGPLHPPGFCLAVLILAFGSITGGAFNPARALSTACVYHNFDSLYLYVIAQTAGALMASGLAFLFALPCGRDRHGYDLLKP